MLILLNFKDESDISLTISSEMDFEAINSGNWDAAVNSIIINL